MSEVQESLLESTANQAKNEGKSEEGRILNEGIGWEECDSTDIARRCVFEIMRILKKQ